MLEQDAELVAAEACQRVALAQPRTEEHGDLAQELVASRMPAGIVDEREFQCVAFAFEVIHARFVARLWHLRVLVHRAERAAGDRPRAPGVDFSVAIEINVKRAVGFDVPDDVVGILPATDNRIFVFECGASAEEHGQDSCQEKSNWN